MAQQPKDLSAVLRRYMLKFDILQKVDCNKAENEKYLKMKADGLPLPNGVFRYKFELGYLFGYFYTVNDTDLSDSEVEKLLTYKKLSLLNTIKNCAIICTALFFVGIVILMVMAMDEPLHSTGRHYDDISSSNIVFYAAENIQ